MATKPLKTIKFPGLSDTYTVPQVDNTLTTSGAAADAKKTGDEISDIKNDLDTLYTVAANPTWEFGFTNANGEYAPTSTKANITHNALIDLDVGDTVYFINPLGNNAYIRFYRYSLSGAYQTNEQHLVNIGSSYLHVIPTAGKYRIQVMKQYAALSTDAELVEVGNNVTIKLLRTTRSEKNIEVNKKLGNAQHVAHAWNVTGTPQLTLLHFSDLHADNKAMARIISDKGTWGYSVDDVICTGDIVADTAGQIASWWNPSILTCVGNHDSASYNASTGYNWTALSMADRDAYYIAPFESGWGIVHTAGTSYYYKDYAEQKVRLIVVDCMLYMSTTTSTEANAQTAWLSTTLNDAVTNGYHVIIGVHAPHGGASNRACSFSKYGAGGMPTLVDCDTPQTIIDAVANAITDGLHFVGYLVGHTHQDNIWDAENDGTQLMYCVTCAAVSQRAQWINSDQNRNGELDAYNLVTIDTDHTLIKLVRGGGADIDDHMRTRKAICFDYSTGQIVGEVL